MHELNFDFCVKIAVKTCSLFLDLRSNPSYLTGVSARNMIYGSWMICCTHECVWECTHVYHILDLIFRVVATCGFWFQVLSLILLELRCTL